MPVPVSAAAPVGAAHLPSLYDLLSPLPGDRVLQRWLPGWAVPPAYGYVHAQAMTSAVLGGRFDRDAAASTLGTWVLGYGTGVAAEGAPEDVVACAGIWQLAAHLAAAAVSTHLGAGATAELAEAVSKVVDLIWPAWGEVTVPDAARRSAGLALHRHVAAWSQTIPPSAGITQLTACAIKAGRALPAAQHRLIHLMLQHPNRLSAAAPGLALDGRP